MATEKEPAAVQREKRWHWRDSQVEIRAHYPKEQPINPKVGARWSNEAAGTVCVWDGQHWITLPAD